MKNPLRRREYEKSKYEENPEPNSEYEKNKYDKNPETKKENCKKVHRKNKKCLKNPKKLNFCQQIRQGPSFICASCNRCHYKRSARLFEH